MAMTCSSVQMVGSSIFGYTKFDNAIKEGGFVLGGFSQNRGKQAVYFALVNALDETADPQFEAYKLFELKSYHVAIYVVDMVRAKEEHYSFFKLSTVAYYSVQRLRTLLQHDAQGEHQKGHPHHY